MKYSAVPYPFCHECGVYFTYLSNWKRIYAHYSHTRISSRDVRARTYARIYTSIYKYIYMCVHPLHPFSTPPRAKITIPLLTPPSLVLLFSFSPIPNSNFSPLERGGIILFSKKLLENECQREREGKRGETLSNRGLFPSLPLKLCFRTDPNRKREREREFVWERIGKVFLGRCRIEVNDLFYARNLEYDEEGKLIG